MLDVLSLLQMKKFQSFQPVPMSHVADSQSSCWSSDRIFPFACMYCIRDPVFQKETYVSSLEGNNIFNQPGVYTLAYAPQYMDSLDC